MTILLTCMHCVITTKPDRVTTQFENFVHQHPMIFSRNPRLGAVQCTCKKLIFGEPVYFCSQCDYELHKSCAEFPRLIKHPHHKDHTLSLGSRASLNTDQVDLISVCGFCSKQMDGDGLILSCIDCDYAEHLGCAMWFSHPHHVPKLRLKVGDDKFRCNTCGELGHGYRMSDNFCQEYDLHLDCYALPGKVVDLGLHSHPFFLISSPTKIGSDLSTTFLCEICHTEANPNLWIYTCNECNYIAHLKCTVGDSLSAVGSSNDFFSFLSITQCEKEQFKVDDKPDKSICSLLKPRWPSLDFFKLPTFIFNGFFEPPKLPIGYDSDRQILSSLTDWEEPSIDVLHCPKCDRPISSQAYSCPTDWIHCNLKANIFIAVNNQTLLDEKLVDELYCPICNQIIFAPTYSCSECQIFFHKSCAEIPHKYTEDPRHVFVLLSPSMHRAITLSNCAKCENPIQGYAYVCRRCEIAVVVVCALGSPLVKLENQKHAFFSMRYACGQDEKCKACGNPFDDGNVYFTCGACDCLFDLHFECALLPYTKLHRRHHHPLVLKPHLNLSVDDYICDVCEKELNPCLWAYRCSDSCATSHVSCIVTSNKKKCHFKYNEECRYPSIYQLHSHVSNAKMAVADLVTALASVPPEQQRDLLVGNLFFLVDEIEHEYAPKVTDILVKMDQTDVLHLMESPDALKAKVAEVMVVFRIAYAPQ